MTTLSAKEVSRQHFATDHAHFDETTEEVFDLLGTVGHEAVAYIERPSSSVVPEHPEGCIAVADGGIEQPLTNTAAPISTADIDGVEVKGNIEARLGRRTSSCEADDDVTLHSQDHRLVQGENVGP